MSILLMITVLPMVSIVSMIENFDNVDILSILSIMSMTSLLLLVSMILIVLMKSNVSIEITPLSIKMFHCMRWICMFTWSLFFAHWVKKIST